MIINGVNAGRQLRGGKFDIGDVWSRRSALLDSEGGDSIPTFTNERDIDFKFVIVYQPDSINANQLLFELARYNFTNYLVRNFEIGVNDAHGLCHMEVSGFRNYDEALQYARQLYAQHILQRHAGLRTMIISEANLELIGHPYSYDDYAQYYDKHFVPLKVSTFRLLAEPAEIVTRQGDEPSVEDIDNALGEGMVIDEGEQKPQQQGGTYVLPDEGKEGAATSGTIISESQTEETTKAGGTIVSESQTEETTKANGTIVSAPQTEEAPKANGTFVTLPEETQKAKAATPATKTATPAVKPAATTAKPTAPATKPAAKPATPKPVSKTGFYFGDKVTKAPADTTKTKKPKAAAKKKKFDLEDEYYDLEGF